MEYTENKSSKKLIIFEIICVLIMIGLIGYTYSYFNVTTTNNTTITGKAASLSLTLNVSKVAPSNTNGLIPQLDEFITSAVIGRNGSCIDDNNNNVCQVYKITVKNTSAVSLYANGTVTLNANNNPNLKWAQISGTSSPTLVSSVNTYSTIKLVENELFTASEEKIYYIVVWISETGEAQYDTGTFTGTVTFGDAAQQSGGDDTGSGGTSTTAGATLTNLGLTANETTPDFSTVATTDEGIFAAEDDLGTSYYFRGAVENNYVYFAGFYWRIIRINGDGTIRMIYDGTSAHANGESSTDRRIGTSTFNESYNDNTYVGYMTGTAGASDYATTHSNTTNSTIKGVIDAWYKTNIVDAGYSESVVDAIYCNDRSIDPTSSGTGIGTSSTDYGADYRLYDTKTPTLKCSQVNDRFTTEATVGSVEGNDKLTYPVGLITADEVSMAGGVYNKSNSSYYLYTNNTFWTMSAYYFGGSDAGGFYVGSSGSFFSYFVIFDGGVRPVITLSSSAITGGTGISTDPFIVSS